jgi:DNA replication protein DnaC
MYGNELLETFDSPEFVLDKYNKQVYEYMMKWVPSDGSVFITAGKDPEINVLGNGTGKSYLLHAVANKLCRKGIDCICTTWQSFLEELKAGFADQSSQKVLREYMVSSVLFLDEMGKEPYNTDWAPEIIYRLLEYRSKINKPLVIASNFDYPQLEKYYGLENYGPSIASRLGGICGKYWVLGGPDRRIKNEA